MQGEKEAGFLLFNSDVGKQTSNSNLENNTIFRFRYAHAFIDSKLYLCHKFGTWQKNAETFAPNYYCESELNKSKFVFEINLCIREYIRFHNEKFKWNACFVGVRVSSPRGEQENPYHLNSGLYLAINDSDEAIIYHGLEGTWPRGSTSILLPTDFSDFHTLQIEDYGDVIEYYLDVGDKKKLFLRVLFLDSFIEVYDMDGNLAYKAENNLIDNKGGYFKVFNHEAQTIISSVTIDKTSLETNKATRIYRDNFQHYRTSEDYRLYYILDGNYKCIINQNTYSIKKDDFIFISPYDTYYFNENEISSSMIQFNKEYLESYFNSNVTESILLAFKSKQLRLRADSLFLIKSKMQQLKISEKEDKGVPSFIILYEILYTLMNEREGIIKADSYNPHVNKAIRYINKNFGSNFTVDDIASYCGITKSHLCRVFKEVTATTITDYSNHVRISKACKDLLETDLSITELAVNNGYNSPAYFNYVFKREVGISPTQYRKINIKNSLLFNGT